MQKGASGADPCAVARDVHIEVAGAIAHRPVHVVENGKSHLSGRLDDGAGGRMRIVRAPDVNRPADTTPFIGAALPVLLRLEHRQDVFKRPAFGALVGPRVVVSLHAAGPNHGIDGTAAAKNMAKRNVESTIVDLRRWFDRQRKIKGASDVVEPDAGI